VAMLLTADAPKKIPRGQPIRPYSINPDGAYSIGLELERDLAVGVLTDLAGRVRARVERAVERPTPAEAMPVLAEIVLELQQAFPLDRARLLGAGIAMPGRYATEGVTLLSPVTLPGWQDFPVAGKLADRLGMPVLVENDAAAATIGERLYGVGRGLTSFVYLFLGGGIGAGLFLDGQLYKGSRSNAGEIGHMIAVSNGLPCVWGKRGCLDRYVSLGAAYDYLNITAHGQAWTRSPDIVAGLSQDRIDAWAETAAEAMRQTIDVLELAFDPQTIVLGGSMPTRLLEALARRLEPLHRPVDPGQKRGLPRIMTGAIGRDTALLGAAALPIFSETNPQFDVLQKPLRQKPQE